MQKKHTLFEAKMTKMYTLFMTKMAKKPYPLVPHIPKYIKPKEGSIPGAYYLTTCSSCHESLKI